MDRKGNQRMAMYQHAREMVTWEERAMSTKVRSLVPYLSIPYANVVASCFRYKRKLIHKMCVFAGGLRRIISEEPPFVS